jgi:HTH-type transcriptional regulator / antitoxin HipB
LKKINVTGICFLFDTMINKHIGKPGTTRRDAFEYELKLDLPGNAIREARHYHNLTQNQLGEIVGVQKAQISRLENSFTNARFGTVIKVFNALNAKVNFKVELPKRKFKIAQYLLQLFIILMPFSIP